MKNCYTNIVICDDKIDDWFLSEAGADRYLTSMIDLYEKDYQSVVVEPISESELEEMHDEMLDECMNWILLGSLSYSPSSVLKAVDPIAYRCSLADYTSEICGDNNGIYEAPDGGLYRAVFY